MSQTKLLSSYYSALQQSRISFDSSRMSSGIALCHSTVPTEIYDFSNYGSYHRLTDDGLTEWHPAFLDLGATLEDCADAYHQFCRSYRPKPKPESKPRWGSKLLADITPKKGKQKSKVKKISPGQQPLWVEPDSEPSEVDQVAAKFINANRKPGADTVDGAR